ncbi:MAG: type I polyketide synthase, partial [Polyangiaceae bacterium]
MTAAVSSELATGLEIAIVGMAGRFPDAPDLSSFWRNIRDGVESVVTLDDAQLRARGASETALADPAYVKRGVLFEGMAEFDAEFFGFSPRAAEQLDPQQRVFLQVAWAALEHAGYAGSARPELTGVYAGSGANFYLLRHLLPALKQSGATDVSALLGLLTGNDKDSLASRVAYKLNLRGPALSIQTACSTSLVAVHQACQSLLCHETDMALAGGVWLNLLQGQGYLHESGGILSGDGRCRAFDASASGTAIGSGAGVVVLRRLSDALADGDTIHAVIKGSAVNNDGSAKVGYTAPSIDGQAAVIAAAQAIAGVSADTIGYVEAHGTGTSLGDPIEVAALTQAFRISTSRQGFCALGSLKTNVGHLDAAAGVAGLIKAVLSLEHRLLPASLNFESPNPQIDFDSSPFFVNAETRPWPSGVTPRRAAVSSFGIGGTNAHLILEEAPDVVRDLAIAPATHCLLLSARNERALEASVAALATHLADQPEQDLGHVAHTLRVGRARFEHRAAVLCANHESGSHTLRQRFASSYFAGRALSESPSVAFLFPGQGAQRVAMGRALYEEQSVFREVVDRCSELLVPHLGLDLRELIFADASSDPAAARLAQTALTQPALFVIEYALARLWVSLGVVPDALLGHSVGEYVAACLAGVFELEDALRVIAARGRLLQSTKPGAMLALQLGEQAVQPYLAHGFALAAVNGVDRCVVSGPQARVAELERLASGNGVTWRRLQVSHAYHSSLVEPVLAEFEAVLRSVPLEAPRIPFVSNVTGLFITPSEAQSPAYWVKHARATVRFGEGLATLAAKPDRVFLELGPGAVLSSLARRHPAVQERPVLDSQFLVNPTESTEDAFLGCCARLWVHGIEVDASAFGANGSPRRVPLPTYPFARDQYWVDRAGEQRLESAVAAKRDVPDWLYVPRWRREARLEPTADGDASSVTLILSDEQGLCEQLAVQLRAGGERVVVANPAPAFERRSVDRYAVRPDDSSELERMLRSIEAEIAPVTRVAHLLCLDPEPTPQDASNHLVRGFFCLTALAQAFDAVDATRKVSITIVASGLEDITGTEQLVPEKATALGAAKVIPLEYPRLTCRVVDVLPPSLGDAALGLLVEQLSREVCAQPSEPWAAYRGRRRWLKDFASVSGGATRPSRLRDGGTYVITGGLGGMGLTFARHLAEARRARLVLLGRAPFPAQETWASLVTAEQTEPALRQQLRDLLHLSALGAEVLVVRADVCEPAELEAAFDAARARFGAIHGVIHAAGVPGGGLIANKTQAEVSRVFGPKVRGTRALLKALEPAPFDFLLLCSSLTAVTGDFAQADYCAANCFLDAWACAAQRSSSGLVLSVNWDVWREVGMA